MKRWSTRLWLTALTSLFAGCATGYHALGFSGGYSEIMTGPNSFIVTYVGNAYTSSEDVLRYSLLRASELTLRNGYKYFSIISTVDQTSSSNFYNAYGDAYSVRATATTIVKPGASIIIRCFGEKPEVGEVFDAQFYWNTNNEEVVNSSSA